MLTAGGLANPTGLAFDQAGNLWVTNRGNATVIRYDASQLASSGSPTPAATLADDGSMGLSGPTGIAFDSSGRLWLANTFSKTLARYDNPSSLVGNTTAPPNVVISSVSLTAPLGMAFGLDGALWVSDSTTISKFSASQLAASGTPTPQVTISGLSGPSGLAFDAAANLWIANSDSSVVSFTPVQLEASGSPVPNIVVNGFTGINLGLLAFYPPPLGSPLAQPVSPMGLFR